MVPFWCQVKSGGATRMKAVQLRRRSRPGQTLLQSATGPTFEARSRLWWSRGPQVACPSAHADGESLYCSFYHAKINFNGTLCILLYKPQGPPSSAPKNKPMARHRYAHGQHFVTRCWCLLFVVLERCQVVWPAYKQGKKFGGLSHERFQRPDLFLLF